MMHAVRVAIVLLVVCVVGVLCLVKTVQEAAQVIEADNDISSDTTANRPGMDHGGPESAFPNVGNAWNRNLPAAVALKSDLEKAEKAVVVVGNKITGVFRKLHVSDGCQCVEDTCGCCEHLEQEQIHLNATACVNITYLSKDYGISITATLNKYVIYNETVSARNPPPICVGAPYVKDLADLCIRLHDVEATKRSLRACAAAEARFKHIRLANYELGCFAIGKPMVCRFPRLLDRKSRMASTTETSSTGTPGTSTTGESTSGTPSTSVSTAGTSGSSTTGTSTTGTPGTSTTGESTSGTPSTSVSTAGSSGSSTRGTSTTGTYGSSTTGSSTPWSKAPRVELLE